VNAQQIHLGLGVRSGQASRQVAATLSLTVRQNYNRVIMTSPRQWRKKQSVAKKAVAGGALVAAGFAFAGSVGKPLCPDEPASCRQVAAYLSESKPTTPFDHPAGDMFVYPISTAGTTSASATYMGPGFNYSI
jgi:hypothetical protein